MRQGSWWISDEPAPLNPDLTTSLIKAAVNGEITRRSPHEKLLADLAARYPFRVRRMMSDMKWLEKKARRRGITFQ